MARGHGIIHTAGLNRESIALGGSAIDWPATGLGVIHDETTARGGINHLANSVSATNESTDQRYEGRDGREANKHNREPLDSRPSSTKGICEQAISSLCWFAVIDVEHRSR